MVLQVKQRLLEFEMKIEDSGVCYIYCEDTMVSILTQSNPTSQP